ncbi:MAG: RHS repeat protein [Desulfobacterales bacterium]|nr:RHS repeat protein [Desulfobacterales bacterium]
MIKHQIWIVLMLLCMIAAFIPVSSSFSGTVTYEYDRLNRIVKMEKPGEYMIEYTYDAAGNRMAAATLIEGAPFDDEGDGDVDGLDLQVFASGFTGSGIELTNFANVFGTHN